MAEKEGNWFKRHKILTVIIVLVVVGVIASASGGGDTSTGNQSNSDESQSDAAADNSQATVAKIGEPARDGKFEFTVKSMKCGEKSIGNEFLKTKAQGQFCRVSLTIKNIGDEAQTLDSTSQYAFNAEGQKYSSDSEAAIYSQTNDSSGAWFDDINPGNTVKGDIFFDVPNDIKPVKVELHDSAFSSGVEITLK